jgi:hypothetical protein
MSSFRIYKDLDASSVRAIGQLIAPFINPLMAENILSGIGGGIAYDYTARKLLYNDGSAWIPLATGGPGSSSLSYSFVSTIDQTILPATPTILTGWTDLPSPPYHDNTANWNLLAVSILQRRLRRYL